MRDRKQHRVLVVFIICALVLGMVQVPSSKAAINVIENGKLGDILWQLDSEGVLRFEGAGEFPACEKGQVPWKDHVTEIKKVNFEENLVAGGDISNYFSGCVKLQSVSNISSGITKMDDTFCGCTALVSVGKIPDTVVSMCGAFKDCKKLNQEVVVPSNVEKASGAFDGCRELDVTPVIRSEKIKDMSYMFRHTAITSAPHLSEQAEDLSYAFSWCEYMKTAPVIPAGVKRMDHTFEYCYELINAPAIPGKVESLSYGFYYCMSIVSPPAITSDQLKDMSGAFRQCYELLAAPVIPEGVTNMDYAFYDCAELKQGPDIPASVTSMSYCMARCPDVRGTMTICTVIKNSDHYYRFAGDTAIYQPDDNPAFLGGQGDGVKINYVKNNKSYIHSYLSHGWNAGTLANTGSFGKLSVGSITDQKISSCTVGQIPPCTYNGLLQRPEPEVSYSSVKLKKGTDYTLSYENNLHAGTGIITIKGKGDYTGSKKVQFAIRKAFFEEVKSYPYSGVYDEKPHSITVICDEGATVEYGTEEGQYTTQECPEYTLPGTYKTYFQVTKPNYVTYVGSDTVTIEERQLKVESEGFSGDYDGNPHSIRVEAEDGAVIKYGTKQGEYTTTICPSYINVGKYTVYYEISKTGCATFTGKRMVIIRRKQVDDLVFPEVSEITDGGSLKMAVLSFSFNQYGIFSWEDPDAVPQTGISEQVLLFTPNDILNYDFSNVTGYDEREKVVRRKVSVNVKRPEPTQPPVVSEPTQPPAILEPTQPPAEPEPEQTPDMQGQPVTESESVEKEHNGLPETDENDNEKKEEEEDMGFRDVWVPFVIERESKNEVSQNGLENKQPGRVKVKKIRIKKKKFCIRWGKIKYADGYQVVFSPRKTMKKPAKKRVVHNVQTTIKWSKYQKYYVKVRAYREQGGKRIYGKWSKVRHVRKRTC